MACYSIVALRTNVKASPEEIETAAQAMGLTVQSKNTLQVACGDVTFSRTEEQDPWTIDAPGGLDIGRFIRETARAKVLREAQRQGYRVTRDERQADRIVIRMKV